MKILIVQNDNNIAQSISQTLTYFGYTPLEPITNYLDALVSIEKHNPDLVILGVKLAGKKDGIDLAHSINENYQIPFIFLTVLSIKEIINSIKQTNPFAILIKPFQAAELFATIELSIYKYTQKKITQTIQPRSIIPAKPEVNDPLYINNALFIKQKEGHIKLKHKNILYIKSDGVYLDIVTTENKTYIIRSTIDGFKQKLNSDFFKIHRSYVVNTTHIEKIIDFEYLLVQDKNIPIGRKYKHQFMELVNIK